MDPEEPEPALEINHELTAKLPEELLKRDLKQGKLGPPIVKHNVVSAVVLDASARRCALHQHTDDLCLGLHWRRILTNALRPQEAKAQVIKHPAVSQHACDRLQLHLLLPQQMQQDSPVNS
jgi:hypothetical protein